MVHVFHFDFIISEFGWTKKTQIFLQAFDSNMLIISLNTIILYVFITFITQFPVFLFWQPKICQSSTLEQNHHKKLAQNEFWTKSTLIWRNSSTTDNHIVNTLMFVFCLWSDSDFGYDLKKIVRKFHDYNLCAWHQNQMEIRLFLAFSINFWKTLKMVNDLRLLRQKANFTIQRMLWM